jgi:hypothetical protein
MKNTTTLTTLQDSPKKSWWKLSIMNVTTWLLISGLVLLNIGCFLKPSILDAIMAGIFNLLDFRTWVWWYFLGVLVVLAFSVRWFLLYQKSVNNDFDLQHSEEAKWFCLLSGTLTFLFIVFVFLHRILLLRRLFYPLYWWFGYGRFSFEALLIFTAVFVIIGITVFLVWKWITVLMSE